MACAESVDSVYFRGVQEEPITNWNRGSRKPNRTSYADDIVSLEEGTKVMGAAWIQYCEDAKLANVRFVHIWVAEPDVGSQSGGHQELGLQCTARASKAEKVCNCQKLLVVGKILIGTDPCAKRLYDFDKPCRQRGL